MLVVYLLGAVIFFLICVYQIVCLVLILNSTYARNLKRIGYNINWFTYQDYPEDEFSLPTKKFKNKIYGMIFISIICILLSWISVVTWIFAFVRTLYKKLTLPPTIKEAAWRLKHLELSAEEVIHQCAAIRGLNNKQEEEFKITINSHIERLIEFKKKQP